MAEEKKYYIKVRGEKICVTEEIHKADNGSKRQVRTQRQRDKRHGLLSIQAFDTDTVCGIDLINDPLAESVEDRAIATLMNEHLHACIELLPIEEQKLIVALYFEGKSERAISTESGIPQKTINNHRRKALRHLKELFEKS